MNNMVNQMSYNNNGGRGGMINGGAGAMYSVYTPVVTVPQPRGSSNNGGQGGGQVAGGQVAVGGVPMPILGVDPNAVPMPQQVFIPASPYAVPQNSPYFNAASYSPRTGPSNYSPGGKNSYSNSPTNGPGLPYGVNNGAQFYGGRMMQVMPVQYMAAPQQQYFALPPNDVPAFLETIKKQVEHYFSTDNLVKDIFIRKQMTKRGYLPLQTIANFQRMRALTNDYGFIKKAVKASHILKVKKDCVKLRKGWGHWIFPLQQAEDDSSEDEDEADVTELSAVGPNAILPNYSVNDQYAMVPGGVPFQNPAFYPVTPQMMQSGMMGTPRGMAGYGGVSQGVPSREVGEAMESLSLAANNLSIGNNKSFNNSFSVAASVKAASSEPDLDPKERKYAEVATKALSS